MAPYIKILYFTLMVSSYCCVSHVTAIHSSELSDYRQEYGSDETTPYIQEMKINTYGEIYPKQLKSNLSGIVIFLHPIGELGPTMKDQVLYVKEKFVFRTVKVFFPTASLRKYTPENELRYIWYDKPKEGYRTYEMSETFEINFKSLKNLITGLSKANNVPLNKIIIGGYKEGGVMALHFGLRIMPELNGIFVLSSYLVKNTTLFEEMRKKPAKSYPKVVWIQGENDPNSVYCEQQFERLEELGVKGEFEMLPDTSDKKLGREQLELIYIWIIGELDSGFPIDPADGHIIDADIPVSSLMV